MACKTCNQNPFNSILDVQVYDPFTGKGTTKQSFDPFNPNPIPPAPVPVPVPTTVPMGTGVATGMPTTGIPRERGMPTGIGSRTSVGSSIRGRSVVSNGGRVTGATGDGTIHGLFTGEIMVGIIIGIILMSIQWNK